MDWKARFGSVMVAVVGALMAMKGAGDLDWAGLGERFIGPGGPMIVFGLVLIIYRSWQGQGQMQVPKVKHLGRKP